MANPKKRVPQNVPGDFFVDSTCIDCDACRQRVHLPAVKMREQILRLTESIRARSKQWFTYLRPRANNAPVFGAATVRV